MITNPFVETAPKDPFVFFRDFIAELINIGLVVAAIIFFFVMLIGGITWMTSGGDKQKAESARSHLTNGVIGLLIVLAVFAILGIVETLFDINLLTLDLGKLIVK